MAVRTARNKKKTQEYDSTWLEDPKTLGLVTAQVEDPELVKSRRAQIITSAVKVFSEKGYYASTIKEIAREADVSPGLIYQYVSDKEQVLFLALQLIVFTLKKGLPEAFHRESNPVMKYYACFDAYCRVVDVHRDASMLTYRETHSLTREHKGFIKGMELETNEIIAAAVREAIREGYFKNINVELFVYHTIMTAHSWALKHWRLSQVTNLEDYIKTNARFLLASALTPKGMEAAVDILGPETE